MLFRVDSVQVSDAHADTPGDTKPIDASIDAGPTFCQLLTMPTPVFCADFDAPGYTFATQFAVTTTGTGSVTLTTTHESAPNAMDSIAAAGPGSSHATVTPTLHAPINSIAFAVEVPGLCGQTIATLSWGNTAVTITTASPGSVALIASLSSSSSCTGPAASETGIPSGVFTGVSISLTGGTVAVTIDNQPTGTWVCNPAPSGVPALTLGVVAASPMVPCETFIDDVVVH